MSPPPKRVVLLLPPNQLLELTAYPSLRLHVAALLANGAPG